MQSRLLLLLLLVLPSAIFSQKADSLEQLLKKAKAPEERADLLQKTAFEMLFSAPEKCERYSAEAISLAKEYHYPQILAWAYRTRGVMYMEAFDKYDLSEKYLDSALGLFNLLQDTFGIAKCLNNKGALNYYQSRRKQAAGYYQASLSLFTAIHKEDDAANVLFNMANMKMEGGEYDSARVLFINFLKIAEKTGNVNGQSIAHTNIGHTYYETGKYDKALNEFITAAKLAESAGNSIYQVQALTFAAHIFKTMGHHEKATSFYYKAYHLAIKSGNRSIQANIAMSIADLCLENGLKDSALKIVDSAYQTYKAANDLSGMSATFKFRGDFFRKENKPLQALKEYYSAINYTSVIENEIYKCNLLQSIGYCYSDLLRMKETSWPDSLNNKKLILTRAVSFLESALILSHGNNQRLLEKNIHEELASVYEVQGSFYEALNHYRKFIALRDSVFSEESKLSIAKMEARHDLELRTKELALERMQLAAARKDKLVIAGISALLVLSACIYLFRFRKAQKLKRENDLQDVRQRISRDLHDEVGSTLSALQLLSHSARKRIAENQHEKAVSSIEKLRENAIEVQETMSDIVWNIKPESDRLESMLQRMREYAGTSFDSKGIDVTFNTDCDNEMVLLEPELKNNIYRIFKEAVNNCVKHSGCTKAEIKLSVKDQVLSFHLADNGHGVSETSKDSHGNGLRNMQQRAKEMGGELRIESTAAGTMIFLNCKITSSGDWLN